MGVRKSKFKRNSRKAKSISKIQRKSGSVDPWKNVKKRARSIVRDDMNLRKVMMSKDRRGNWYANIRGYHDRLNSKDGRLIIKFETPRVWGTNSSTIEEHARWKKEQSVRYVELLNVNNIKYTQYDNSFIFEESDYY